jgi:HK97 family phage portal protein
MKNVDMQYMEVMKLNRTQVASIFRVPPHKIGDLEKATFANIEHQSIEYVMDCLFGWAKRRESSIRMQLIDQPRYYYGEHSLDALLRGDLKARYDAYAVARQWGWLNVNDIRRRENMNGIGAAGTIYMQPLNMVPAGTDVTKLDAGTKKHLEEIAKEIGRLSEF